MASDDAARSKSQVERFEGAYWYDRSESPRWSVIESIDINDGKLTFHTADVSHESVPHNVRERAYARDDDIVIIEVDSDGN